MKISILSVLLCIAVVGCGGSSDNADTYQPPWAYDYDLCIELGGDPKLLEVYNIDTGDYSIEVNCVFMGVL